jgi:hypothetical protein
VLRTRQQVDPLEPERHQCARVEMSSNHSRDRGSTMSITTYGLDLAKRVFVRPASRLSFCFTGEVMA